MEIGTRVGGYEVTGPLGHGGMGEVYRATDLNLKRQVAIKVLSAAVAGDAEHVARLRREAELLATLNHPHIAQIYGLETAGDSLALVMELVDGPTLADRIAPGPLPVDEALAIARQIAEALEAAHDQGVVHRDLKPSNIKVRADGTVKVLDFGLAKSIEPSTAVSPMSPTITTPPMTHAGVILGTAVYMSPEQARGRAVDRRTDIWSFGCVLFEMLSGRRPFNDEDTVSDTLANILKGEPRWAALPGDTPPPIRSLLQRCLRKDVRQRVPHIAQARIEIEEASGAPADAPLPARRGLLWPAIAALSTVAAAGLAGWIALAPTPGQRVVRFEITAPPRALQFEGLGRTVEIGDPISPDGTTVALTAIVNGSSMIWVRRLDAAELRVLPRTEGAARAYWSPDSRSLAFFSRGQLTRIDVAGGPPIVICKDPGRDAAWNSDGVILIGGRNDGLRRVDANGGTPVPATELAPGETTHDYPTFLPDNRRFLYLARRGPNPEDWSVYAGSLDSRERSIIPGIHTAVRYSPSGHLLFIQGQALIAQRFDPERLVLTGDPEQVVAGIPEGPRALFDVSANGTLAHLSADVFVESQLAWVSRTGSQLTPFTSRGIYNRIALSPDGRYIAFDRALDILMYDLQRNAASSFINSPGSDVAPIFSYDGSRVAFASRRSSQVTASNPNPGDLYERVVQGAAEEREVLKSNVGKTPTDWSRDGYLLFASLNDLWAVPSGSSGIPPRRLTATPFGEAGGRFSPDGRWIAYQSNDSTSGQDVYVQSFPDGSRRYLVSVNGGTMPRWARDGTELFYVAPDRTMMAVPIRASSGELVIGTPTRLFQSPALQTGLGYDVARDGRFLLNVPAEEQGRNSLVVIVNWAAQLPR